MQYRKFTYFLPAENCLWWVKYTPRVLIQHQLPYVAGLVDYPLAGLLLSCCEEHPSPGFFLHVSTPEVGGGLFAPLVCLANSLGSCPFSGTMKWTDLQSVFNLGWEHLQYLTYEQTSHHSPRPVHQRATWILALVAVSHIPWCDCEPILVCSLKSLLRVFRTLTRGRTPCYSQTGKEEETSN